jgi:hypothetical protein
VTITTQSVIYFIPWTLWEWIKVAMGSEQQAGGGTGWYDPPSDDAAHAALVERGQAIQQSVVRGSEAREDVLVGDGSVLHRHGDFDYHSASSRHPEAEGRHEGVQERHAMRDGSVSERSVGQSVESGVREFATRSSGMPEVRGGDSEADGHYGQHTGCSICYLHTTGYDD